MALSLSFTRFLAASVIAAVAAATGCATPAEGDGAETGNDEIVAHVLSDKVEVRADSLVFPKDVFPKALRGKIDGFVAAKAAGTQAEPVILVADRQKDAIDETGALKADIGNPYGYIRRALSYRDEGERTVVTTEIASIEEAFQELDENGTIEIGAKPTSAGGLRPQAQKTFKATIPVVNLNNRTIFEKSGLLVRIKTGKIVLDTNVDLGVNVSFFRLKEAHVVVDADVRSELELEAVLGGIDTTFDQTVFQGRWPIGSLGPIPITAGVTASVECNLKGQANASATAGARADIKGIKAGVRYERDKGVDAIGDKGDFIPEIIPPRLNFQPSATAQVRCLLKPTIDVRLWDVAGPNVTPALVARLDVSTPPPTAVLHGGVDVLVGGTLQVFGKELGKVEKSVWSFEKELWRGQL